MTAAKRVDTQKPVSDIMAQGVKSEGVVLSEEKTPTGHKTTGRETTNRSRHVKVHHRETELL